MTRRLLPLVVAAGTAVSACGGHAHGHATVSPGQALFTQACGACHTLTGHNDPRHQGGDLLGFHAARTQLDQFASEMPVRHQLSSTQLDAVVRYLIGLEGGRS